MSHFTETNTTRVEVAHVATLPSATEATTDNTTLELRGARSACEY